MIIKNSQPDSSLSPRLRGVLLVAGLLLILVAGIFLLRDPAPDVSSNVIYCSAEQIEGDQFRRGNHLFNNAHTQSNEFAFSGNYASKLSRGEGLQFGFGYTLKAPLPGTKYRASVWRYRGAGGKGMLVVSGPPESKYYKSEQVHMVTQNNWEYLEIIFTVPIHQALDHLQVYVYSGGEVELFFDDLKIEKIGRLEDELGEFQLDTIRLQIDDRAMRQLRQKRNQALRNGILETEATDWVPGNISKPDADPQNIRLRLKGDWLNHLQGDKWSFRVKVPGGEAWNRLRYFSLHTPAARGFLHEWLLHRFFQREDVLTTHYEFVLLELNGQSLGVYALEEHFDKVLVERQRRREGVVVKFSEEGFWKSIQRQLHHTDAVQHELQQPEKNLEAATIQPFREKTTLASPELSRQFEAAQQLLQQYQLGLKPPEKVFDLDRMARYFAICDVAGAYHSLSWHNLRLYYNPLTAKLEPMGFDGFESDRVDRSGFTGQGALNDKKIDTETFHFQLFLNKSFTEKYSHYLWEYSNRSYLQHFFAEVEEPLRFREKLLQSEFDSYRFDASEWMKEAQGVHLMMLPQNNISLKAYTQSQDKSNQRLLVGNVHSLPIEIIGYGVSAKARVQPLDSALVLEGFIPRSALDRMQGERSGNKLLDTITGKEVSRYFQLQSPLRLEPLEVPSQANHLFYRPLGIDTVLYSSISPWPSPYDPKYEQELFAPSVLSSNAMYTKQGNQVFFRKGKHTLDKPLIVGKGHQLHFEAGCQIDLQRGAFIMSHAPVKMLGEEEAPVVIRSGDGTGRGFHLFKPEGKSTFRNALFEGLTTIAEKDRVFTGAVTLYEAPATFSGCTFRSNHCEDALNLIRSEFRMERCLITQTFADGLDADFCKGEILQSRISHTGNDGLDISGSVLLIDGLDVEAAGDKGISIGEDSDASIVSSIIRKAQIAIAVKDLSVLLVQAITLEDCRQGFVAFQKKPEYGGSKIYVNSYEATGVKKLYNVQKGCMLELEGQLIEARR